MTYRQTKKSVTAVVALAMAATAQAQIPTGYYDSLKGKKGADLKNAVYEVIKKADVLDYGSGKGATWDGFYDTDRTDDNRVIDRYSNDTRYFGNRGSAVSGMNIEHSFAKSWWGGSKNQAYCDLFNLMPSETKINSTKSNYPMGTVTGDDRGNGCTKVGKCDEGYYVWEPADKWKGDFARDYMYMATCYQKLSWQGTQANQMLQKGDYPTLKPWAYTLFIEWARQDAVDEIEVKRNDAVQAIQNNRNPYVDFPNLMEYVWGDSTDYAFDPETTMKSTGYTGGGGTVTPDPGEETIYTAEFRTDGGGFTAENNTAGSGEVWVSSSKYGWKGTGYISGTRHSTDASLVSPVIDLTGYASATIDFSHAVNYTTAPQQHLSVEIRHDGQTTTISEDICWPAGNSWTYIPSGTADLSAFAGKQIQIVFHYTSNTAECSTWEIENMTVKGKKGATGIDNTTAGGNGGRIDMSKPYEMYGTDGRRITGTGHRGIIILRQGSRVAKTTAR